MTFPKWWCFCNTVETSGVSNNKGDNDKIFLKKIPFHKDTKIILIPPMTLKNNMCSTCVKASRNTERRHRKLYISITRNRFENIGIFKDIRYKLGNYLPKQVCCLMNASPSCGVCNSGAPLVSGMAKAKIPVISDIIPNMIGGATGLISAWKYCIFAIDHAWQGSEGLETWHISCTIHTCWNLIGIIVVATLHIK